MFKNNRLFKYNNLTNNFLDKNYMSSTTSQIPISAGIGLRQPHYNEVIDNLPDIAWFEVHSENFFCKGGMSLYILEKIRQNYPLSLHGVGLSLGSVDPVNKNHLQQLKALINRFEPGLVSDHISWSSIGGIFLPDLLPLPYTHESLENIVKNIQITQDFLGRQILVENPSTYLEFKDSEIPEVEFISEVIKQSGCGLLLDINNIYVSAINNNFNPYDYLSSIPIGIVKEIHLAGHFKKEIEGCTILIDHHGDYVTQEVWDLYSSAINRFGKIPTLIEWDT
ncbi:MAG: Protein of uncharacterized function, partial [Rickettsiaceae bacterium]|nr:Protein of uncharacterized function [Rickettsiaceae bacterium]